MRLSFAVLVPLFASLVSANISPTVPIASTEFTAGTSETVEWTDDNASPSLSSIGNVDIYLYTGSKTSQTYLATLATNVSAAAKKTSVNVPTNVGVSGPYYWLRFRASSTTDAANDVFSSRFSVTHLTGSFNTTVLIQLEGNSDLTLPSSLATLIPASATASATSGSSAASATSSANKSSGSSSASATTHASANADTASSGAATHSIPPLFLLSILSAIVPFYLFF